MKQALGIDSVTVRYHYRVLYEIAYKNIFYIIIYGNGNDVVL